MPIYDDEDQKYSPDEIKQREQELGSAYNQKDKTPLSTYQRDKRGDKQSELRQASESQEEKEWSQVQDRAASLAGIKKEEDETEDDGGDSLYKPSDKKSRLSGLKQKLGGKHGRSIKLGAAGGAVGVALAMAGFLGFLRTFQLDHFNKTLEKSSYSRLNASLDARNKYLVRAYIKARVTELEGGQNNENLYFKANKVDTDHPMTDWYRTMRKNGFEEKLLNEKGISFVSLVDANGQIQTAKITGRDAVPRDVASKISAINADGSNLTQVLNSLSDEELNSAFTVDTFDSSKPGRRAVKAVVDEGVPWFRVMKRRHIRKDLANVTGIGNWRLFDKTRKKAAVSVVSAKDKMSRKIINKIYANNPSTKNVMLCLFASGRCGSTSDPESPANKKGGTPNADTALSTEDKVAGVDAEGNAIEGGVDANTGDVGNLADEGISELVEEGGEEVIEEASKEISDQGARRLANASFSKKILYSMIAKFTGKSIKDIVQSAIPVPSPDKIWIWAVRIAKIDAIFKVGGEGEKLVKNARSSQMAGLYATAGIANDQIKSGELVPDELTSFFDIFDNVGNTEGWAILTNQNTPAEFDNSSAKKQACDGQYVYKPGDFQYFCDSQKPNNGGNAQKASEAYEKSIGVFLRPVSTVVEGIKNSPFGAVIEAGESFVSEKFTAALTPVTDYLQKTELGQSIGSWFGEVFMKLLDYMGAGPIDLEKAAINGAIAGGAIAAENSTRSSGGAKSTKQSSDFSNKLAQNHYQEQQRQLSINDRYFSLENNDSVVSKSLFAASSASLPKTFGSLGNILGGFPQAISSVFSGKAFAQTSINNDLATWAGADRYDIPAACVDRDPLEADLYVGTNYDETTGQRDLDWGVVRDNDKLYKKVYEWAGTDQARIDAAQTIYSCHVLDARSMGNLGYVFGYTNDGGLVTEGSDAGANKGVTGNIAPGALAWPVEGENGDGISRCIRPDHDGWDIYSNQTPSPNIFASADGTVKRSEGVGTTGGFGNMVTIHHKSLDLTAYYPHLALPSPLKVGDEVKQGQLIGIMGNTGNSRGIHLHYQLLKGDNSSGSGTVLNPTTSGLKVPEKFANSCAKTGEG